MEAVFQGIREHVSSGNYPSTIGGFQVSGVRDLTTGYDSTTVDNVPTLPVSASSQMITFTCEIGAQLATVSLRGSGTEPKLKFYCEVQGTSHGDAQTKLQTLHTGVVDELLCPDVHGLASA
jgi:phosphoglucomutase